MDDEALIKSVRVTDRSDSDFMVGREIEHTPAYNMQTLFLPKIYPVKFIMSVKPKHCTHLYFGANKGFPETVDSKEFKIWEVTVLAFLKKGFWCTLDFQPHHWNLVMNSKLINEPRFIPLVSLEVPGIERANYNTCIKLDDTGIEATNGGVWVHELHNLRTRETFTRWDEYRGDKHHKFLTQGVNDRKRVYGLCMEDDVIKNKSTKEDEQ